LLLGTAIAGIGLEWAGEKSALEGYRLDLGFVPGESALSPLLSPKGAKLRFQQSCQTSVFGE